MRTSQFGETSLTVSELCLGTSTFARYANQQESFAILDAFRAAGGNLIQTSGQCPGASLGDGLLGWPEEFLGRWMRARSVPRSELIIGTRIAVAKPVVGGVKAYQQAMLDCVHDSLRRMGLAHLDLLLVEWTSDLLPLEESMACLDALVRRGVVRHVVAAHFPVEHLAQACGARPTALDGVQLDYSLVYRARYEMDAAPLCREHGLGFIARSPLAGGYLVSTPPPRIGSFRCRTYDDPAAAQAAGRGWSTLSAVATAHCGSPAQIALAWVLGQPRVDAVLISARDVLQLRELIGATGLTLSSEDRHRLEAATEPSGDGAGRSRDEISERVRFGETGRLGHGALVKGQV
ncbi:aldo/keto reductase [Opitutus terrae]|uniref:Aldo/keto reductase n=1 Tax=Opitutus terrae (strain DSM 11246 / JCM 15787 / PB90-1) TaxID=452637 RepID=B1ZU22_OPITP|nr:aldo/keto reductase [Opitutus terrae]ACB75904.1 aldo/keto reductase [Opitutus terrae PB90-1]